MAGNEIRLEYPNVFEAAVGAAHGIAPLEFRRGAADVQAIVRRVESERKQGQHRYRELPADRAMLRAVKAAVKKWQPDCDNLVVLGIGGSALGNIALQTALNPPLHNLMPAPKSVRTPAGRSHRASGARVVRASRPYRRGPRLFVADNVDPVQFANLLEFLGPDLRKTVFNMISKSGETAETAAEFLVVRDLLARTLGSRAVARQVLVTTDPETGTARQMADAEGCDTLPVPSGVGGRFSVLSAVGLFSAGMCGIDIGKLLAGAADMSKRCESPNVARNPAATLAQLLYTFYVRGKRIHVLFPYSYQLKDLADWWRQLWAESLGKNVDLAGRPTIVGPTPVDALGATDQHSQVQLYREGPRDKVFIFLAVDKFARDVKIAKRPGTPDALRYLEGKTLGQLLNAEKRATEYALRESECPCLTIRFPRIDEHTIGQFIMLWEAATTIMGYLLDINPYDQPAVQMGKDYTYGLMGKDGYQQQGKAIEKFARASGKHVV